MGRARWLWVGTLAWPGLAWAADGDALDLKGGAVGELTGKTLGIAHGLLAFLLVLGLVVELLRGPGQRKRYLAIVWRTMLVLALLQAYTFLAGSVVKQCTSLAQSLSSKDSAGAPLEQYRAAVERNFAASVGPQGTGTTPSGTGAAGPAPPGDEAKASGLGGFLFEAIMAMVTLLALAVDWVFTELSRILIAFFYAIGPLALVFHVPGLDAPGRWLRSLVTVSCWPVVSSVLLHLSASVLTRSTLATSSAGTAFGSVASALLLCVLAFATPKIASALVGGVGNLLGEGASAAVSVASGVAAVGILR
jgi:hypothetical protein